MAFVDWYVPQLPKKTRNEKKALQCLSQDDDKALRQLLESGLDPDMKIRYWSSDRTLIHIALVANHANKCGKYQVSQQVLESTKSQIVQKGQKVRESLFTLYSLQFDDFFFKI